MPIYEYQCKKCSHEFEQLIFDRGAPVHCPECGSKRAKKLPSVFARHGGDSDSPQLLPADQVVAAAVPRAAPAAPIE